MASTIQTKIFVKAENAAADPPGAPLILSGVAAVGALRLMAAMEFSAALIVRPPPPLPPGTAPARVWPGWLAAGAGIGVLVGSLCAITGVGPWWMTLLPVLILAPAWLLVVAVHAGGHLAGGWATGGKFLLCAVGPLRWQCTPAGVRFYWNRRFNVLGGLAACLPLDPARVTPRRLAVMIAGGPLASALLALAGLGVARAMRGAADLAGRCAHGCALEVAGLSLLVLALTVFPRTQNGFKSDGRRVLELLRGDRRSQQEMAMITLTALGLVGVRLADYDPRLVAQATALRDGSLSDLGGQLIGYYHAADLGETGRAQVFLDRMVEGEGQLMPFVRDVVRCEYAWFLATHAGEPMMARAWLDGAGPAEFDPAVRLRAEAAVLLAEGRRAEAAARAKEGLQALAHRSPGLVKNAFAEEALEDLIRRAEGGAV
ncbi:MAG: hypothetical protein JSS11_12110 [Verrucomicrobia bacterium]|nr:hypothetical protein [Verrucomicrobiota bacterium]